MFLATQLESQGNKSRERFVMEHDLICARIVLGECGATAMGHHRDPRVRECFLERADRHAVGERVADSGGAEDKNF